MDGQLIWLFLQQGIASGLVVGSVYALLALAIVMIFKTSEVPNFAQGEVLMATGYVALYLLVFRHVPIWVTVPLTIAIAFAGAALFRWGVLTQVARASGSPVNLVIATLGLSYVLKGLVRQTGRSEEHTSELSHVVTSRMPSSA